MAMGLNDLEPSVATAFTECLQTVSLPMVSPATIRKEFQEHRTEQQQRLLTVISKHRWLGEGWLSLAPLAAAFACVFIGSQMASQPWLAFGLFGGSVLLSGVSFRHTLRKDLMVGFRTHLPSEVLFAARPLMNLSPAESVYVETAALLAALQGKMEEQTARNILLQLNTLLVNNRQLETQRQRLAEAVEQHSTMVLEADKARFIQKLGETDDTVTRQSLQQSLQMCESRLEDARTMEQNLQRVMAQQEAIQQTFASAQSSLIRMQTTPSLSSPAVEEITQTVKQINLQTQAVEAAVEEVAVLSAQR